jgi:small subunit ribosomal protein S1
MTAESNGQPGNEFTETGMESTHEQPEGGGSGASPMGPGVSPPDVDAVEDEYMDPSEMDSAPDVMDAMMDQYLDQMSSDVNQGQMIQASVIAVKSDGLLLDVGDKSEGFVPLREVQESNGEMTIQIGDVLEVIIKSQDPETGLVALSYREARRRKAWQQAEDCFKNRKPIEGKIIRTVKGGVILDIGTTAFLPASQIELTRTENFEELIGRVVQGYVIEFVPDKRRIIVSRRALLQEERDQVRGEILKQLEVGQELEVNVKRLVDFGAFVDVKGLDGLIPRSEISWQRSARPEEYLTVGETIRIRLMEIDQEKGKLTLSRRQAIPDPWSNVETSYPVGSKVSGKVVSLTNYGAFVRLQEGLDGMVHISDMAWDSQGMKPSDFAKTGDELDVEVLNLDPTERRISLGMKQLTTDPWSDMADRYPKGHKLRGKITGLTRYGAFVELETGVEGMVHISDFSWGNRIAHPKDIVKAGEEIDVCVLSVDRERRRISLGVKQLVESPVEQFRKSFKTGDLVEGRVVRLTDQGVFIQLNESVDGFMHVSQMDAERVENPADMMKQGEKVISKITKIERGNKITLSRKAMLKEQEKKTISTYLKSGSSKGSLQNMGELLEDLQFDDELGLGKPESSALTPPDETGTGPLPGVSAAARAEGPAESTTRSTLDTDSSVPEETSAIPDGQALPDGLDESIHDQPADNSPPAPAGPDDSSEPKGESTGSSDISQPEHVRSSTET